MAPVQLGLVIHPHRRLDGALQTIRDWAAEPVDVAGCDLVLALGGDGTTLTALHAAAPVSRPVLGVACGSIGVLTSVPAERLSAALDHVAAGAWSPRELPALE